MVSEGQRWVLYMYRLIFDWDENALKSPQFEAEWDVKQRKGWGRIGNPIYSIFTPAMLLERIVNW